MIFLEIHLRNLMLPAVVPAAAVAIFFIYLVAQARRRPSLPRVGKSGIVGYISTAVQFFFDAEQLLREGYSKFSGRPYILPSPSGPFIVLGSENVEILRKSDDSVFNQPIALNEALQFDYTMMDSQRKNLTGATITRSEVKRAVTSHIPDLLDILEETELVMQETFDPSENSEPIRLPVFKTMTYMIARISNRAIVGTELCRNDGFIRAMVRCVTTVSLYAAVLQWLPVFVRPAAYFVLSSILGGLKQPFRILIPYVEKYIRESEETDSEEKRPKLMAELLISNSHKATVKDLAIRIMRLNFASVQTSSIFLCQALLELVILPKSDLEDIRTEIMEALEHEGGWNKAALARFRKIDSLLKEVGRVYGFGALGLARLTIRDGELADGTQIPSGYKVAIDLNTVHFNSDIYEHPHLFDAFRFSRDESAAVDGFTTVHNNYLPFGTGHHVCPGRFFAAMGLKIMIAHLLLNYDLSLPPGMIERPKNIKLNATNIPHPRAELIFKRRLGTGHNF